MIRNTLAGPTELTKYTVLLFFHAGNLTEDHGHIPLLPENPANGRPDLVWGSKLQSRPGKAAAGTRDDCSDQLMR